MSDESKSRISLVCAPHDGSRSPAFLKFQRDFRAGTQAEFVKDDEYSVWQALNDIDQGGNDPNAPPMPGGNALAPAQRKRLRRQALAYKMAYAHIDDERIREMEKVIARGDRDQRIRASLDHRGRIVDRKARWCRNVEIH